ncbi:MAG: hypothetical protein NC311_02460 [Muribaculaceae bacterium]|nr:hypothetical protein [Muribaculaceae bacterium]
MKKKYLYSLLIAFGLFGVGPLASCDNNDKQQPAKPKKHIVYVYKRPELKFRVDTIDVTDDNFKDLCERGAGGVYFSGSNTVTVKYFRTNSKNALIKRYCKVNNDLFRLNKRHEMEHARKYEYVHNKKPYSPFVSAKIAAMNETMAPASEIIEAMDYHYETGECYPSKKMFIVHADSAITSIMQKYNLSWPVNYCNPMIADAVIKYSLESLTGAVNRGYYTHTMKKAYNSPDESFYTPMALAHVSSFYNPTLDMWGPLWTFETTLGDVDIFNSASFAGRQNLIDSINSIVAKAVDTDKMQFFNRFAITR